MTVIGMYQARKATWYDSTMPTETDRQRSVLI